MKRILKIAAILVGLLAVVMILIPLRVCFLSVGAWGCPDSGSERAMLSERESIQTSILSLMVDNDLTQVTASVSGHGGEKIRSTGTQFHETIILRDYMDQAATLFCYRWDADGRITFQYDVDDNINCAIDAEQLFP